MNSVHLLIPDLFLPKDIAAEACRDLRLPALEKMLGRGHYQLLEPASMEEIAVQIILISHTQGDAPIAEYLCRIRRARGRMLDARRSGQFEFAARPVAAYAGVQIGSEEAAALCANLNAHFAGRTWNSLRRTRNAGICVWRQCAAHQYRAALAGGRRRCAQGLARQEKTRRAATHCSTRSKCCCMHIRSTKFAKRAGNLPINSVVAVGKQDRGQHGNTLRKIYDFASSDDVLAEMFAAACGHPIRGHDPAKWNKDSIAKGRQLLVWTGLRSALQRGDLSGWRICAAGF